MRRRKLRLTVDDRRAFEKYAETNDLNYLSGYYLSGFTFMPWQYKIAVSEHGDIVIIGGVGSGKTMGHASEELLQGLLLRNYASMTLAPTSWQANLTFKSMLERIGSGPFERFLAKDPVQRPWPEIQLTTGSTFEFRSASDIDIIQGWGGDSMTLDEAGVMTSGDYLISGMASRLRGLVQASGGYERRRRGRLKLMSTSYIGGEWVFGRYDSPKTNQEVVREAHNKEIRKGQPIHYLEGPDQISMTVTSASNVGLSNLDIERMKRRIARNLVGIQMEGDRPVGIGEVFTSTMIRLCEDWDLNAQMERGLGIGKGQSPIEGWEEEAYPGVGPVIWCRPKVEGRLYAMAGDPGTGNPPFRNSPVIMIFDVTEFPLQPAELVAFYWISGHGGYSPFLVKYFQLYNFWQPAWALFDSTATQKGFDELVFQGWGLPAEGFNFSGMRKGAAIGALALIMSRGLLSFPYLKGIREQLAGYVLADKKIAQDIVATMSMIAAKLREFMVIDETASSLTGRGEEVVETPRRRNHRSSRRTTRGRRR